MKVKVPPVVMSIAGVDPSGGAGVFADLKTFHRLGCFGTAAITSLTFQNTLGVFGSESQTPETVRKQIAAVFDDSPPVALKTGMLPDAGVIGAVEPFLQECEFVVVDPVVRSTSGYDLIDDEALEALVRYLFPVATIVTPNIPEAERITNISIDDEESLDQAGRRMLDLGAQTVLIKGGHFSETMATDYLFDSSGRTEFSLERLESKSTHGTGCTLSAAIVANLAHGYLLMESIRRSKEFVHEGIRTSPGIGKGNPGLNHWAGLNIGGDK